MADQELSIVRNEKIRRALGIRRDDSYRLFLQRYGLSIAVSTWKRGGGWDKPKRR